MFSSKSICDNMLSKVESEFNSNKNETSENTNKIEKVNSNLQQFKVGNTVIIIEHNLDVIKLADWIIDIGPEGGRKGGMILSTGTPEEVAKSKKGYTPKFLKNALKK